MKQTAFRLEADLLSALQEIKHRDGVPVSEQVRRALRAWVESKGVTTAAPKRPRGRRRPKKGKK